MVIDGPFAETKELVAGFWLWQVKSKEEAIEWVKRQPQSCWPVSLVIEIRQVFESGRFLAPNLSARGQGAGGPCLRAEMEQLKNKKGVRHKAGRLRARLWHDDEMDLWYTERFEHTVVRARDGRHLAAWRIRYRGWKH